MTSADIDLEMTQFRTGPLFRSKEEAHRALSRIIDGFKYKVIPSQRRPGWWTIVGEL